jgi:hypothetical protein
MIARADELGLIAGRGRLPERVECLDPAHRGEIFTWSPADRGFLSADGQHAAPAWLVAQSWGRVWRAAA